MNRNRTYYQSTLLAMLCASAVPYLAHAMPKQAPTTSSPDQDILSPIQEARAGNLDAIKRSLKNHANVNEQDEQGRTALIWASIQGHEGVAQELIQANPDLNAQDMLGMTALMWAIGRKHTKIALELIHAGSDINMTTKTGSYPLIFALKYGNLEVVRKLIEYNVNLDQTYQKTGLALSVSVLVWAIKQGRTQIALELIKAGANVHGLKEEKLTPLMVASYCGNLAVIRELLKHNVDLEQKNQQADPRTHQLVEWTALMLAINRGHTEVALELIRAGADISVTGQVNHLRLVLAAQRGDLKAVRQLIRQIESEQTDTINNAIMPEFSKDAALRWAIARNHTQVATELIGAGIGIHTSSRYGTPLILASQMGNIDVVRKLIGHGVDLDQKLSVTNQRTGKVQRWTALMCAIERNHSQIALELIDAGSPIGMPDDNSNTPLILALLKNNLKVAKTLLDKELDLEKTASKANTATKDPYARIVANHYDRWVNTTAREASEQCKQNLAKQLESINLANQITLLLRQLGLLLDKKQKRNLGRNTAVELEASIQRIKTEFIKLIKLDPLALGYLTIWYWTGKGGTTLLMLLSRMGAYETVDQMLRMLTKNQIDEQDNKGQTALMYAAEYGHTETVQCLLQANANRNLKNKKRKTARQIARCHREVVNLLDKPKETTITKNRNIQDKNTTPPGTIKETCNETTRTSQTKSTATTDTNKGSDKDQKQDMEKTTHALLDNPTALIELLERQPDATTENGRPILIDTIIKSARAKASAANYRTILQKIIGREQLLKAQLHMLIATGKIGSTNLFHALALLDAKTDKNAKSIWHVLEQIAQNIDPLVLTQCLNQTDENGNCPQELAQHPETESWLRKMGASDTCSIALAEKQQDNEQMNEDEEKSEEKVMPRIQDKQIIADDVHRAAQAGRSKELSSLIHRVLMQAQHPKAIVQQASSDGNTALHYAVLSMKPTAVRALTKSYTYSQQSTTAKKSRKGKKKRAKKPKQRTQQTAIQFNFDVKNGDGHTPLSLAQTILEGTAAGPLHDAMKDIVSHLQKSGSCSALTHPESADTSLFDGSIAQLRSALQAQNTAQAKALLQQHGGVQGTPEGRLVALKPTVAQTGSFGDSTSQFYTALQKRNHIRLQQLLQQKPGLANSQEPKSGMSALQCAVQANNIEATALLLSTGAAVDETIRNVTCKKLLANGMNTDIFVQLLLALNECARGLGQPGGSANPWIPFYTHVRENHFPVSLGGNRDPDKSRFTVKFLDSPRTHQKLVRLLRDAHTHLLQNPRCVQPKNLSDFIKSDFYPLTDGEVGTHEAWCIPLHTTEVRVNIIAAIRDGKMKIVTAYPVFAAA